MSLTEQQKELLTKALISKDFHKIYYNTRERSSTDKVLCQEFEAEGYVLKSAYRDPLFTQAFKSVGDGSVGGINDSTVERFNELLNYNRNINDYQLTTPDGQRGCQEHVSKFKHNGRIGSLSDTNKKLNLLYKYGYLFNSTCGFHTHCQVSSLRAYKKLMTMSFKGVFLDWFDNFNIQYGIKNAQVYKRRFGDPVNSHYSKGTLNPLTRNSENGGSFYETQKHNYCNKRYEFINFCFNIREDRNIKRKTFEIRLFAPLYNLDMAKARMRSLNKMINGYLTYYQELEYDEIDQSRKSYQRKNPDFYYNGKNIGVSYYSFNDPLNESRFTRPNQDTHNKASELNQQLTNNGLFDRNDLDNG